MTAPFLVGNSSTAFGSKLMLITNTVIFLSLIFPALLLLWLVIHLAVTDQKGMLMGVYLGCLGVMVFIFASMMG